MNAALIVVDMLNDFFERSPVLAAERAGLVASTNGLVRAFHSAGLPVVWVRQEFASDLHDGFLDMRTNNVSITINATLMSSSSLTPLEILDLIETARDR